MESDTTVAWGLRITDESAGYDAACKRVLSEKAILARIMKACLVEYTDCDVRGIAKGITETTLSSIRTLMKNMGISAEQAMKLLEVPEAEQSKYRRLLSEQ